MKNHIKVYLNYFDYTTADFIPCENCNSKANDIHHLKFRSQLGKDNIENLIALCRNCHNEAHNNKEFNQKLKEVHENHIKRYAKN